MRTAVKYGCSVQYSTVFKYMTFSKEDQQSSHPSFHIFKETVMKIKCNKVIKMQKEDSAHQTSVCAFHPDENRDRSSVKVFLHTTGPLFSTDVWNLIGKRLRHPLSMRELTFSCLGCGHLLIAIYRHMTVTLTDGVQSRCC